MWKVVRNLCVLAAMIAYLAIPRSAKATSCDCSYCFDEYQSCAASCNGDSNCINACANAEYECSYWCYYPCVYG